MKKLRRIVIATLVLNLGLFATSQAQVTIAHDTVWYFNFPCDDNLFYGKEDSVFNNTNSPIDLQWKVSNVSFPDIEWELLSVCEPGHCIYEPNYYNTQSYIIPKNGKGRLLAEARAFNNIVHNGTAFITVSTAYGDMVFAYNITTSPLSTNGIQNETLFTIYPNPSSSDVDIKGHFAQGDRLIITNSFGHLVDQKQVEAIATQQVKYNVHHLANGIYYFAMLNSKNQLIGASKFIKQ